MKLFPKRIISVLVTTSGALGISVLTILLVLIAKEFHMDIHYTYLHLHQRCILLSPVPHGTLDTDELFRPIQLTTIPSGLLFIFCIVMVDIKGSASCEETLENVKLVEFIINGVRLKTLTQVRNISNLK